MGVVGWGGGRGGREGGMYPDVEVKVLVCDGFDVEAYCRDGSDDFADLESVEEGRFAGVILGWQRREHISAIWPGNRWKG